MMAALFITTLVYFLIQTALNITPKGAAWRDIAYYFLWWPMLAPLLIVGLPLILGLFGTLYNYQQYSSYLMAKLIRRAT